jgi:hypothetical protein
MIDWEWMSKAECWNLSAIVKYGRKLIWVWVCNMGEYIFDYDNDNDPLQVWF